MKASELRIGNLATDSSGNLLRVIGLNDDSISYGVFDSSKFPLPKRWQGKPIPLTDEWLLKFGFTENTTSWTNWQSKRHCKEVRLIKSQKNVVTFNLNRINSVHRLQNLYHALTGEELTIKQND